MHEGGCITYQRGFGDRPLGHFEAAAFGDSRKPHSRDWRTRRWIPNGSRGAGYPEHSRPLADEPPPSQPREYAALLYRSTSQGGQ